jgi:hypothetical protein
MNDTLQNLKSGTSLVGIPFINQLIIISMMKRICFFKSALLAVTLGLVVTSCEPESEDHDGVITFEDVALDNTGYWNGSDLSGTSSTAVIWGFDVTEYTGGFNSGILTCNNVYNGTWYSWSGFACSDHTDMDSIGVGNQYSVYATSGAGGSANFALVNSDSANCVFDAPVNVKSMMVNNSTYTYWALKEGKDGAGYVTKFKAGDYFLVTVTGYDSTNVRTGSLDISLAEFRDGQTYICDEWTKISLVALGKVKKLSFSFASSDSSVYGINTPAYICIDNLVYRKD